MKKILASILTLGVVAAVAVVATNAFFTDTETSTGNTFVAGDLDLTIDNTSYLNHIFNQGTSWKLGEFEGQLFFNFSDLKPGDEGEDTISFHVTNNSWLCAQATLTANDDVTCVDGETPDDLVCSVPDIGTGDLGDQLHFMFWGDDGDNVLEDNETVFAQGAASNVLNTTWVLDDSAHHNVGGTLASDKSLLAGNTYYVGKAWCFGTLTETPLTQDGVNNERTPAGPLGSGVHCDGTQLNNSAMTDKVMANLEFTATQARNNPGFLCVTPTPTPT